MAFKQTTEQYNASIATGSVKFEYADMGDPDLASWTDIGYGEGFSLTENMTKLSGTPDNGEMPDVLIGIGSQTADISASLWSLNYDNIIALRGGIDVKVTDTGVDRYYTGGKTTQVPVMIRMTNRRVDVASAADAAKYTGETLTLGDDIYRDTTYVFFKVSMTTGDAVAWAADDAENPIAQYPFTMQATEDQSLEVGKQLFYREPSVTKIV